MINPTYAGFEAWLKAKDPVALVGISRGPCTCPLGRYLSELTGHSCTVGKSNSWMILTPPYEYQPLPAWMEAFITQIDKFDYGTHIAAEYALECLHKVAP